MRTLDEILSDCEQWLEENHCCAKLEWLNMVAAYDPGDELPSRLDYFWPLISKSPFALELFPHVMGSDGELFSFLFGI